MSEDDKKPANRFAGWKRAGEQVAQPGASEEIVRKAAALNPALKEGKTTRELAQEVSAARRGVAAPTAAKTGERQPAPRARDVASAIAELKAWLAREEERLAALDAAAVTELDIVAREREALIAGSRARVEALAREVNSPKTQALLQAESAFLRALKMK